MKNVKDKLHIVAEQLPQRERERLRESELDKGKGDKVKQKKRKKKEEMMQNRKKTDEKV